MGKLFLQQTSISFRSGLILVYDWRFQLGKQCICLSLCEGKSWKYKKSVFACPLWVCLVIRCWAGKLSDQNYMKGFGGAHSSLSTCTPDSLSLSPNQVTKSWAHVSLSERWRSYWSMFIHRPHHTVIIDGVAKDSPQSIHPCVFVHPYIYICVCLPRVNRSQLPFFSPPLLLDTVSYHPFPCHDMELFIWNYITMRNVSTRLWNATAWTWDQEREKTKEAEQEDKFWKMEDDFSKGQTLCEQHRFQGNLVTYDEGSPL